MKRILLIAVLLMVQLGFGQVSSYTFSQSIETYASLSGGTVAHNVSWDDSVTPNSIPLGFTFYFNELEYTTCSVNSDGYLTFGTTISEALFRNPISSTRGYQGAISALAIDLVDGGASIVYQTIGTAPNRTFVVQWANAKRYVDRAAPVESFNFQIRLNETSNTIQVVYGDCRTSSSTDRATEVGLRGANNSDFNNRIVTNNWTSSTAGTANSATCNTGNDAGELPTNGLTYKWTPVPPTITSLSSTNGCIGSTITINGTRLTGATAANVRIGGTPVASITSISSTQIVAVVGSGTTGLVTVTSASGTATSASVFTVNPAPTTSNAGVDQSGNSTSYTLSANTPTVGTGAWSIISGPNTSLTQFSNVSNPLATFSPSASGTYVLNWTITNGSCTSFDQVAITPCMNNLITNGDFNTAAGGFNNAVGWTFATSQGRYVETYSEDLYFSNGNAKGWTSELDSEASLRQTVTVTPGVSYTLSFVYALRGGAPSPGAVNVKIIGGAVPSETIFTTSSNTPAIGTFTFTPSSSSIAIEFFNSLNTTTTLGTIIDNIVLVPSSQVTPSATTIPKGVFNTLVSCAGTPVQLDVENVPSSGVTYSWTGTAGVTFSATNIKNPIATFTNNGLNEATVTVTTAGGCISSSTTYVNINRINGPTITTAATPATLIAVCQSATVQNASMAYSATTNSPTSYRIDWDTIADQGTTPFTFQAGAGNVNNIIVPANTPAGTYTGTMIVTNANCSSTKAISLTVGKTASSASSSPTLCQNTLMTPITHTTTGTTSVGSPTGLPTGVSATWASNTITISGTPTQSGTFNYSIPLIGSCTSTVNATGTITVNPLPAAPTVGTITNVTCSSATGSVVLSGLPSGSWIINQIGASTATYSGSGTSFTVTGLAVGDYSFRVNNGTCTSVSTPNVPIADASSTTWNGLSTSWSNGLPDATKNAIVTGVNPNSPFTSNLTACALTISSGVIAIVPTGVTLTITNAVTTNGQLIFENNASLVQTTNVTNTGA
ncbi:beta strand repeat-containing protein, partial [Flavobacterium succinicans]|uniref:beta strand repeat-containing protein n=1 Tax=Flavobacterium succinicans TaxID=29536 RepID=UPI0012FC03EC